uniref:Uncharacterized protein n=1 Tax=Romanomermis culicivorax TaxID=13658 RepID=A0A915JIR6_ROMCU
MMHSINETAIEMSKSDKKLKKRKHEESSPASQDGSDESVVEELLKQYETYKTQFEEWTTKNKGNVSQEAYDKYVDDFRSWEKIVLGQIKSATKKNKSKKKDKKRSKGDKPPRDQVEVQETPAALQPRMPDATAAPLDPLAMMMTMAMMMMPAMMQQQQQTIAQPVAAAAPPQVFQLQQALPPQMMPPPPRPQPPIPPAMLASGGVAPSFLVQQSQSSLPAPAAVKSVALPDLSRPPPNVLAPRMVPPSSTAASTSVPATPNFPESRRPTTIDYGHGAAAATQEYDDYWYRKNQERLRNEVTTKPSAPPPPRPLAPPSIVRPTPPSMPFAPPPQRPFRGAGPQSTHRHRAPITGPPLPLFPELPSRVRDNDRNGVSSSTSPNRQNMPPTMNNNKQPQHRLGARDFSMRRHV